MDQSLINAGKIGVIPNKKLAWFRASMLTELSDYFEQKARESYLLQAARFMRRAEGKIGENADPAAVYETDEGRSADAATKLAEGVSRNGVYCVGRPGFLQAVFNLSNLPMMLWVSLRVGEPNITIDEAKALIQPDNEETIQLALAELMGYRFEKKDGTWVLDRKNLPSILATYLQASQNQESTDSTKSAA